MQGDGAARATRQHLPAGKVRTLGSQQRNCTSNFQALVNKHKSRSSPSSRITHTALARQHLQKQRKSCARVAQQPVPACGQLLGWGVGTLTPALSLPPASRSSEQLRGAREMVPSTDFKGIFLLSLSVLYFHSADLSLDMVSLDLFYNTTILFCLYCIFPALVSFTLPVLLLSSCLCRKLGRLHWDLQHSPMIKLKWPWGKIIIKHPFKTAV